MHPFRTARQNMINGQLRPNGVNDPVFLAAMDSVPREIFVEPALQGYVYADEAVPVAPGRYLPAPSALARPSRASNVARCLRRTSRVCSTSASVTAVS